MFLAFAFTLIALLAAAATSKGRRPTVVMIENAEESYLHLDGNTRMWYRTWGNREFGIPVLFVHGGPGNAIGDYNNINSEFFDHDKFWVVESDQRGTGRSQPSVWDDWRNMKYYENITIEMMSNDFEALRKHLMIDKWLVFGGSWGSTLSLDYAERFPERSLGLSVRGVFLNTAPEFDDVYSAKRFIENQNEKQQREFDIFFNLANKDAIDAGDDPLDKFDSERIVEVYSRMIRRGDIMAMWVWYVYENNLMEEDPHKLLDFDKIDDDAFPEASGVAFFETQLFLHGLFVEPVQLLERVKDLKNGPGGSPVHTWVCQGHRDQVCPEIYAKKLVDALEDAGIPTISNFIDAPHQCTDPVMQACLKGTVDDFYLKYNAGAIR